MEEILERVSKPPNTRRAKNLVLFVGAGMSTATLTAARILKGHRTNTYEPHIGELEVDRFPFTALARVS